MEKIWTCQSTLSDADIGGLTDVKGGSIWPSLPVQIEIAIYELNPIFR